MTHHNRALEACCEKYGFKVLSLFRGAKHEIGKTYWCNYWGTWYTVTKIEDRIIYCTWEDGHKNNHSTSLDTYSDKELVKI